MPWQYIMAKQSKKTQALTRLVGGVKKRGMYQQARGVPTAQIDVNRLMQKKQRETRIRIGRVIYDIAEDMLFVHDHRFEKRGITKKGVEQVLSLSTRLRELRVAERQRDLFPFGYDRSTGKQLDAAGVETFRKLLAYEKVRIPYLDLIEVFSGASNNFVFPYPSAVILAKLAHALIDPRKHGGIITLIDMMTSFIRTKTPAFLVREVDLYFKHAIVDGNLRVSVPSTLQKRRRDTQQTPKRERNDAPRRQVKAIRR